MGDRTKLIENQNEHIEQLTHGRILTLMALITIIGGAIGTFYVSMAFGGGIVLGGILSFVNYYWLKFSLKKVFDMTVEGEKPSIFGAQYVLRYLGFGLLMTVIYLTKTIPVTAVILGLTSFAFAVVVEGIFRIFNSVSNEKGI